MQTKLPDKVNEPTFARLNKFLQEHVPNVSAKRMTVRTLGLPRVAEILVGSPGRQEAGLSTRLSSWCHRVKPFCLCLGQHRTPWCRAGQHVRHLTVRRCAQVRAVYEELCTFNASKTCCWELFAQMAHGCSWSDLQAKKTTGTASVEEAARLENVLQRLFAKCAEPVKKEVEKAVTASDA